MKKISFNIIGYLLTSFLVSACAINGQSVEVTRPVQQTLIVIQHATPSAKPYPPPSPFLAYPPNITTTPISTPTFTETPFIKFTQTSPTLTNQQVSDKIAGCYQVGSGCSACEPKFNNSIQQVVGTTRMFINVPKDLYPKELFRYATTVDGQATMGWISNGGLPGEAFAGSPVCWSTYVEFDGRGEVDLRIPSILVGVPDYFVRFIVD